MKVSNSYQRVSQGSFVCDICHKQIEPDSEQVVVDVAMTLNDGFYLFTCLNCSTDAAAIQAAAETRVNK